MARAMRRMSYRIDAIYAMYTPLQGVWRGIVALDIILFALYHLSVLQAALPASNCGLMMAQPAQPLEVF